MSDVHLHKDAKANPGALTARAYEDAFGLFGSALISISLIFFVLSTIIVVVYYGSRMAEFLFGETMGTIMKIVYIISITIGSVGYGTQLWILLDLALAFILIPNVIAVLLLSPQVKRLTNEFFSEYK